MKSSPHSTSHRDSESKNGPQTISSLIDSLAQMGNRDRVSFAEVVEALGKSGQGLLVLVFAIPCCLPMPPGIPTICGIAILTISVQVLMARETLYLPRFLLGRTIQGKDLVRLTNKVRPLLRWIERFTKPRAEAVVEKLGFVVIGILGIICGITLILPIPFLGNLPPGYAVAALAIGMIQRDGLVILVGVALAVVVVGMLATIWWGATNGAGLAIRSMLLGWS